MAHFHSQEVEYPDTRRENEKSRRDIGLGLQGSLAAFYVHSTNKQEAVSKKNFHLSVREKLYPMPMKVTPTNERRELSICDHAHSRYMTHLGKENLRRSL